MKKTTLLAVFTLPDDGRFLKVEGADYPANVGSCHNCMYRSQGCPEIATGYCKNDTWATAFSNVWITPATEEDAARYLAASCEDFYRIYGKWPEDVAMAKPSIAAENKKPVSRKLQIRRR